MASIMLGTTAPVWGLLLLGLLAANAPFLTERRLLVFPTRGSKPLAWRLLELLLLTALMIGIGTWVEMRLGQRSPQGWAFYVVMLSLMLTFAFPGFVWRCLRRGS